MANTHSLNLELDSSQAASAADHATLKPSGNFTVEFWIKPESSAAFATVFQSYSENTNHAGINIGLLDTNKIQFIIGRNTGTTPDTDFKNLTSTGTCADGAWTHVACVYDGTKMYIYFNGVEDSNVAWTNAAGYAATNYVRVGCRDVAGTEDFFYDGLIDEVRLWATNRSEAQILANYLTELNGDESNLNAYWKLNNDYEDSTANNNDLTGIASPTFSTDVPFVGAGASGLQSKYWG